MFSLLPYYINIKLIIIFQIPLLLISVDNLVHIIGLVTLYTVVLLNLLITPHSSFNILTGLAFFIGGLMWSMTTYSIYWVWDLIELVGISSTSVIILYWHLLNISYKLSCAVYISIINTFYLSNFNSNHNFIIVATCDFNLLIIHNWHFSIIYLLVALCCLNSYVTNINLLATNQKLLTITNGYSSNHLLLLTI